MTRTINVGLLGIGRAGLQMHIPEALNYPGQFRFVAAADHDPERMNTKAEGLEGAKRYADCDALIADPDVELVTIALRHPEHTPYAIKALEAGKYVQIDKPIALNYAEGKRLAECAARHPGRLFPRHNRRFEAAFQKALALIDTGILGKVSMVKLYRSCGYCRRNDWMTMQAFGGGLLTNWGPHVIDHALQYLRSPVREVWADLRRVICIGDGDDQVKILLRAENGMMADLEISGAQTVRGHEIEVWGERGTMLYDHEEKEIVMRFVDPACVFRPMQPHPENPPLRYGNMEETLNFVEQRVEIPAIPLHIIWKHMYDSIVNGIPFPVTMEESLEVVRLTDECFKAAGWPIPK